jgi:hypothetical protein
LSSSELQVHHAFERPLRRRGLRLSLKQWLWVFPLLMLLGVAGLIVVHWFASALDSGTAGLWILSAMLTMAAILGAAVILFFAVYMLMWNRDARQVRRLVLERVDADADADSDDEDSLVLWTQRVGGFDSGLAALGHDARGKGTQFICRIEKGSLTLWQVKGRRSLLARISGEEIEGFEVEAIPASKPGRRPRFSVVVQREGRVVLLPVTVLRAPKGTSLLRRAVGYQRMIDFAELALRTGKVSERVLTMWEE